MQNTKRKPYYRAAYPIPRHLATEVAVEAARRRLRPANVLAEILAERYGVPIEQEDEGPPHKA